MKAKIKVYPFNAKPAWNVWLGEVLVRNDYRPIPGKTAKQLRAYARRWLETFMPHVTIEEE